jgi:hypothetical protein
MERGDQSGSEHDEGAGERIVIRRETPGGNGSVAGGEAGVTSGVASLPTL